MQPMRRHRLPAQPQTQVVTASGGSDLVGSRFGSLIVTSFQRPLTIFISVWPPHLLQGPLLLSFAQPAERAYPCKDHWSPTAFLSSPRNSRSWKLMLCGEPILLFGSWARRSGLISAQAVICSAASILGKSFAVEEGAESGRGLKGKLRPLPIS